MKAVDPNLPRGLQFGLTWVHRISLYQAFDACLLCNVGILRRWDIGQACVFYCSSAGGYISGVERLPASVPRAGFVVDLAAEFGGDDLVTVVLDNNDSEDITAGDGFVLGAGGYLLLRENFGVQGTLSYKVNETSANNSDLGLERWIVDVSAIGLVDNFQFLAGVVHHMNVDFDGDGFLQDFSFDDATGLKVEVGYSWFALSYTNIEYEVNGFTFDASNVGLRLRGGF